MSQKGRRRRIYWAVLKGLGGALPDASAGWLDRVATYISETYTPEQFEGADIQSLTIAAITACGLPVMKDGGENAC